MATVANLSIAGISGVVVLIIIIIVVIWIVRRSDNDSRSNSSGSSDRRGGRRRFRVKTAAEEDAERFEVEHGRRKHHHRRKSSSCSSSSSSSSSKSKSHDDDVCFRPGGLGDVCLLDATGNTCAQGLACQNGRCVCPQVAVPVVAAITQGGDTIVADWNPVLQADFYEVILYRVLGPNQLDPVEIVSLTGRTVITFGGLIPGNYQVFVRAGSSACGINNLTVPGIANVTVGVVCGPTGQCPPGTICQNGFCVPLANVTGQGLLQTCATNANCAAGLQCQNLVCVCPAPDAVDSVTLTVGPTPNTATVTWPTVPGADIYQVSLFVPGTNITQTIIVEVPPGLPTASTTFTNLELGRSYLAEVRAGSTSCGIAPGSPSVVSNALPLVCGPPPTFPPGTVANITPGPIVAGQRSVTVTWTSAPGATRYFLVLEQEGLLEPVFVDEVTAPTAVLPNLTVGGTYTLFIYPASGNCDFGVDNFLSVGFSVAADGCTVPTPVTNILITNQGGITIFNWTASPTATSYDVQIFNINAAPILVINDLGLTTTTVNYDIGSALYRIDIYAVNACGRSVVTSTTFNVQRD